MRDLDDVERENELTAGRVLAEHGDTQQVREAIKRTIWEPERGENVSPVERVIAVVTPIVAARDAAAEELHALKTVIRMQDKITFELQADLAAANAQLERYDGQAWEDVRADLAAARGRLDQVRAAFQRWSGGPDNEFEQTMRDLLDAPARPAGHDESGQ